MPSTTRYLLHSNGPALWPERKPVEQITELRDTTPPNIWEATYQGNPTAPGGTIFKREWWQGKGRYDAADASWRNRAVARWHSWDTALKDKGDSAYTSLVVGELMPDYRMIIRLAYRERLAFPELCYQIERHAERDYADGKLRGVIIEDKASGTSAIQTLQLSAADWLRGLVIPFQPSGDKPQRAGQASVWCANGCVLLPHPSDAVPWLVDFEDELFNFPGSAFADQVDAFGQLILYTENLLAEGYRARG